MARLRKALVEEGMVVVAEVRNGDGVLLIPAGCVLTERHINILEAWGIEEVDVKDSQPGGNADPLAGLSPEAIAQLRAEVRARFWEFDRSNPVSAEIFQLLLRRHARRNRPG